MAPKKRSSIKRRLALDSDDDDVPPLAPDSDVEFDEGHGPAAKAPPPRRAIVPASSSSASAPVVPAPPPEGVGRAERRSTIRRRLKAGEEDLGIVPAATGVGAVVASAPQAGDLPFNALLKRKWCLGQKSSADVQEEAAAAAAQSAARRHADEPSGKQFDVCVFLNDGYHSAAYSTSRERLQPANAVLLRLQSVQCSRGFTQQQQLEQCRRLHATVTTGCRRNDDDAARCCSAHGARKPSSRPKPQEHRSHCKPWTASWSAASMTCAAPLMN